MKTRTDEDCFISGYKIVLARDACQILLNMQHFGNCYISSYKIVLARDACQIFGKKNDCFRSNIYQPTSRIQTLVSQMLHTKRGIFMEGKTY